MTRTGSLLVVDDNEDNRDVLSRRLRNRGYTVSVAADGPQALALTETQKFDLILLDVEMPGMSGLEVLSRIRANRSHIEFPVIMVTARTEGVDIVEAFRLGANDYVTKPVDFPVALARIATHVSHKWAVEDLRDSEERFALAVRGANDGLWDWNLTTNAVYWSPRWKAMLGYDESEISATPQEWLTRVHPEDRGRVEAALAAHIADGSRHFESEHRILHRNETFRWVLCRGAAVRNGDGTATRLAGSLTDITETKLADALTGLPNRILFFDLVERAIKRAERRADYVFALLVLGLDRFNLVHDSLGPLSADRLLVAVARRLQSSLRSTDAVTRDEPDFTLARVGGDEFNVLLDDITDARDAIVVAERLRHALEEPFEVDGNQLFISATTGIAVSTTGYDQPEAIVRDATTALNRARAQGNSQYQIFDPAMRARAISRLQVETDLRQAIETRAFEVYYQPIISFDSGLIAGFEALLRWRHPVRGLVSPAEFIPIAEDTGMILDIGRFALAESCRQMAAWQARFGAAAPERHVREHLQPTARRRRFAGRDCGRPGADGPRTFQPEARDHGDRIHQRRAGGTGHRQSRAGDGDRVEPRRFRHRLFVAELSPPTPGRHRQGGPFLREPSRNGRGGIGDGPRDCRARPQPWHGRRCRGGRDRRTVRATPGSRL